MDAFSFSQVWYLWERKERLGQALSFLRREIVHFLDRCHRIERRADSTPLDLAYVRSARSFAHQCLAIVDRLLRDHRVIHDSICDRWRGCPDPRTDMSREWGTFGTYWDNIWETLRRLPHELFHLVTSALQRRNPSISYHHVPVYPTVLLREAHPAHPAEIRAIESLSLDCFRRFGLETGWWPPAPRNEREGNAGRCVPPHIAVTNQSTFRLDHVRPDRYVPEAFWREPGDPKAVQPRPRSSSEYRDRLGVYYALFRMDIPRWSPATLRLTPLLAHQHAHPLVALVDIAHKSTARYVHDVLRQPDSDEARNRAYDHIFGPQAANVRALTATYKRLEGCWLQHNPITNVTAADHKEGRAKAMREQEDDCRRHQLGELVCDLLGLLVCNGPPYYWALLLGLEHRLCDVHARQQIPLGDYPPSVCRILLMRKVMRDFDNGFSAFAPDGDEERILRALDNAACATGREQGAKAIREYWACLSSFADQKIIEGRGAFAGLLDVFEALLPSIHGRPARLDCARFEALGSRIYNSVRTARVDALADFRASPTPLEVVGAMWWRLTQRQTEPPRGQLELAWRQAIVMVGEELAS